jgi:hypothetical protein
MRQCKKGWRCLCVPTVSVQGSYFPPDGIQRTEVTRGLRLPIVLGNLGNEHLQGFAVPVLVQLLTSRNRRLQDWVLRACVTQPDKWRVDENVNRMLDDLEKCSPAGVLLREKLVRFLPAARQIWKTVPNESGEHCFVPFRRGFRRESHTPQVPSHSAFQPLSNTCGPNTGTCLMPTMTGPVTDAATRLRHLKNHAELHTAACLRLQAPQSASKPHWLLQPPAFEGRRSFDYRRGWVG